jgi:hypothetical protein
MRQIGNDIVYKDAQGLLLWISGEGDVGMQRFTIQGKKEARESTTSIVFAPYGSHSPARLNFLSV